MRLGNREAPAPGFKRVLTQLIAHARGTLANFRKPERAVHEVRKDMKKLRGLLRLAEPALNRELYRRANCAWAKTTWG